MVESDDDPELLFSIPFNGAVKLTGICVIGENDPSHPNTVKLYDHRQISNIDLRFLVLFALAGGAIRLNFVLKTLEAKLNKRLLSPTIQQGHWPIRPSRSFHLQTLPPWLFSPSLLVQRISHV